MPAGFEDFPDVDSNMPPPEKVSGETVPRPLEGDPAPEMPSAGQTNDVIPPVSGAPPLEAPAQQGPPEKKSGLSETVQRRFSKVTKQRDSAREQRDSLQAERDLYKQQYEMLRSQVYTPPQQSQTQYTQPGTGQDFLGSDLAAVEGHSPPGKAPQADIIRDTIKAELQPVFDFMSNQKQLQEQQQRVQQVQVEQQQSLASAIEEFPELSDPNTDLYRVTDELLRQKPSLRNSPDGPYEAAMMARGILAEEVRAGLNTDQMRRAATTVNQPAPSGGQPATHNYKESLDRLQFNSHDFDAWRNARKAQLKDEFDAGSGV
jgi:hypothetical protein